MGSGDETTPHEDAKYDINHKNTNKSPCDSEKQDKEERRLESEHEGVSSGLRSKPKYKKTRRKERKRNKVKAKSLKIVGINSAGLMSKLESFENLLVKEEPSVFSLQETKCKKPNKIRTESTRNYTIYELLRKNSGGGGLCIGVHNDLQPVWIAQGDDEVEVLVVEFWVNEFPIRIVNGYGPQVGDSSERKRKFWEFIEREVANAIFAGAGFLLQMDGNCHLGKELIKDDVNV